MNNTERTQPTTTKSYTTARQLRTATREQRRLANIENARKAYEAERAEAIAYASRILATLEGADADQPNWGHAGSMESYKHSLREVSDSLHHEGEYAN